MSLPALNGWTAARLDDLARDVEEIRHDLAAMRSQEVEELKSQLHDAQIRPRAQITAYLAPFLAAMIPTLVLILSHG